MLSKYIRATIGTVRGDDGLAEGHAVDPLGIVLRVILGKRSIVSSAVALREQLDVSSKVVEDHGGLSVLQTDASSLGLQYHDFIRSASIVPSCDVLEIGRKCKARKESCQQEDRFNRFTNRYLIAMNRQGGREAN